MGKISEYRASSGLDIKITFACEYCGESTTQKRDEFMDSKHHFCSLPCFHRYVSKKINVPCTECGIVTAKKRNDVAKVKLSFCSRSCRALYYHRQLKTKQVGRRSRGEQLMELLIRKHFPSIHVIPNDRQVLDGLEIDIHLPAIKMGIEWNGIFHRKALLGDSCLEMVKQNDALKREKTTLLNIDLLVIDEDNFPHVVAIREFPMIYNKIKMLAPQIYATPLMSDNCIAEEWRQLSQKWKKK